MNSRNSALSNTTNTITSTIDTIINKGAHALYDKYITKKLPPNVRGNFQRAIQTIFNPMVNINANQTTQIASIHQSIIEKIHVSKNKEEMRGTIIKMENNHKQLDINNSRLQQKIKTKSNSQFNSPKRCHERKKRSVNKNGKLFISNQSYNKVVQQKEPQQYLKVWNQRQIRWNQQKIAQQKQKTDNQKSLRLRKNLEQQYKQLQQNNKFITFNHQTCTIIKLSDFDQSDNNIKQNKQNMVSLRYSFSDAKDQHHNQYKKQQSITSTRKITSFERRRRQINTIDQNVDQISYNNNGQRQTSTIPFMDIQQGVVLTQGNHNPLEINQNNTAKNRINSASMTHRTFKSYTKQKIDSARYYKTIATSTSAGRTKYLAGASAKDQKKYTLSQPRQSIIFSSKKFFKNHKIHKNAQLMQNFFDFTDQFIE